jgi:uncharacterized protein with HEPN domain
MSDPKQRSAADYLSIMERSAEDALKMIDSMDEAAFAGSSVTFHAVAFCHFLAGQAAADLMQHHPEFATDHPQLPWTALCETRDHILNDFARLQSQEVWLATHNSMKDLKARIAELRHWRAQGE